MKKQKQKKLTMWNVTSKYMAENSKARGLEITHAVSEFIDNSIDAGANNVFISKERQENGLYTLTIEDDGAGIESDRLFKCFSDLGYERNYSKKSISSFGVGSKEAMSFLTNGGTSDIYTVKDGILSHLFISFNPKNMGLSEVESEPTNKKSGTTIIIRNVEMTDKDHNKLMDWISFIYSPAKQLNPKFQIFFRVKLKTKDELIEVPFIDVMYSKLVTYDNSAVELHFDKQYKLGNTDEMIKLKVYVFKTNEFIKQDLFSHFDRGMKDKGSFSFERAGIYWRLGGRYSNYGKGNFISMTNQHSLNNVRMDIDISGPKLMKLFGVNQNKSKITITKAIENNPLLKPFFDELKIIVNGLKSTRNMKKSYTEDEQCDKERLNDFANSAGDFTGLIQELDENKRKLQKGSPEEREEVDPTGIKRNRKSGYKQNRDSYRVEYMNISPWAPFMELPKIYSNKYIYTINTAHPYYEVFASLSEDAQNHIIMNFMTSLSVLLYMENESDESEFTRKFIEKTNSMLNNWVESSKYTSSKITDMNLDLD